MSTYFPFQQPTPVTPSMISHTTSHHTRHRRAPRLSVSQNSQHKQFRGVRSMKELAETTTPVLYSFRDKFEAGRSFDLEDDLEFIPMMLTDTDIVSIGSDRSSVSSGGSCESSPLLHHQTIAPAFALNSASAVFVSAFSTQQATLKLHQPSANRVRNAIPIINPDTGSAMRSSPPTTRNNSPSGLLQQQQQQQQAMLRRW